MTNRLASRRDFLKIGAGAASAFVIAQTPRVLLADDAPDAPPCVLRVVVTSDVHFNGSPDAKEVGRFRRVMRFSYDYAAKQKYDRLDALMVVGDMSNHGIESELSLFKKTMDEEVRGDTKTLLCMGNHEFYGGNQAFWKKTFGVEPNARYQVNGYQFIAISPEKGTMADGDYMYALEWFQRELEEAVAADPEKPVFVFQHYPVTPTVYGGRGLDDWGAEDLFDTLQKYPTVVNFSGHTHYPLTDPRVAWQGNFSAFGTSTLSYICHGGEGDRYEKYPADSGNYAEFYIMEVYADNSTRLLPCNASKEPEFYEFAYLVSKPGDVDSYQYSDARYFKSARPEWSDGASLVLQETTESGANVEIPQASCPDVVHSYRFDLERADAAGNWVPDPPQFFWAHYYDRPVPKTIVANLDGLDSQTKYRAAVYALNPFMRQSEAALRVEFTTKADPDDSADRRAERPDANLIDVRVVDGKLVNAPVNNREKQIPCEIRGAVGIVDDAELGTKVARFDGKSGNFVKLPCSAEDYRRLRRATIAAKFRVDASRKAGVGAVFGNTEQRGSELSVNYDEKKLKFWASIGKRAYTIVEAPIEPGRWIDAYGVFDGKFQILYIDGKEIARLNVVGSLTHPTQEVVQAFCVGSDIAPGGGGSDFFTGEIARAKLYNWALTPEQIAALREPRR